MDDHLGKYCSGVALSCAPFHPRQLYIVRGGEHDDRDLICKDVYVGEESSDKELSGESQPEGVERGRVYELKRTQS